MSTQFTKNFQAPWPFPFSVKYTLTESITNPFKNKDKPTAERLANLGAKLAHIQTNRGYKYTVVYRPVLGEGGTMYEVAVACCSPKDSYNRKVGADLAIARFEDGKTVQLPLTQRKNRSPESALRLMLGSLSFAYSQD